ncbi:MAG: valine--tRNA ligase [Candidatus Babeliales bacterium]|nr:valine--tRNA ligase [Candidatus Babeliales bacterium]
MEKRFEHQLQEPELQKKWESQKTYSMAHNPGKIFSIDTPPPTVSGTLHIGHIFSYTQTDIIARYKRMSGYSVFYPFGFDDNGLPTERYVEKKRGVSGFGMSRSEFIKICLEESHIVEEQFKALWQKIGISADWQNTYSTISAEVRKISQESFIRLLESGFIYRKNEPALYCTTCFTSVAQAELDDIEVNSFFNDIEFITSNGQKIVIGTTRPELLASCVAILYNPEDTRYQHLKDAKAIVPIYGFEVPILADDKVSIEKGTGLVMCCTFGDKTDIEWYKKFKFPFKQSVGLNGKWTELTGPLHNLKVHDARKKILELLKESGNLVNQKPITHSVNVHERCKKEIEYIELSQWFIKILEHKQAFLDMGEKINWYPAFMKSRYTNWVENLSWDWCISRQRFYGIPFPVWHCKDCNAFLLPELKDLPMDPQESKYKDGKCIKCSSANIVPDTDVMDTWNTSSLTPQICYSILKPNENVFENVWAPMSMRPQAHDIIRTWAFDTIVKSWMHNNNIPWENIVISGHVLSTQKEKISKSKENESMTPDGLLSRYPADAIRYWTASGTLGQDVSFSEDQIKIGMRLITKLWNALRFGFEHLQDFTPEEKDIQNFDGSGLGIYNQWILHNASVCFEKYQNYFEQNEFGLALDTVEKFFWNDYCDNYLEIIKDQLFNPDKYTKEEVHATKWTLVQVGLRLLQLYAPYLPYVTDAIFDAMYQRKTEYNSIHLTKFYQVQHAFGFEKSAYVMEKMVSLISTVRRLKTEQKLSLKVEIDTLTIVSKDENLINKIKDYEQLIKGVTQSKNIKYEVAELTSPMFEQTGEVWDAKVGL